MTNIVKFEHPQDLTEQACVWLARLDRGLTVEEQRQFVEFLSSPVAKQEFEQLAMMWDKLDVLSTLSQFMESPQQDFSQPHSSMKSTRRTAMWRKASAIAAGVLFSVLLPSYYWSTSEPTTSLVAEGASSYETAIGEHTQFALSDHSDVYLNTDSKLKVAFSSASRVVELEKGEAHFDVSHDPNRPFSVLAKGQLFQAVGTAFTVRIIRDTVELVVTEGAVRVNQQAAVKLRQPLALLSSGELLEAGARGLFSDEQQQVSAIAEEDVQQKLSWRDGNIIFSGDRLEDAISKISRYTQVEFEFVDEATKNIEVAGRFKYGDIDNLLATLQDNFNIHWQKLDENKVLLSVRTP